MAAAYETVPKTLAELRDLQKQIWIGYPSQGQTPGWCEEFGQFSAWGIRSILASIEAHELVCELTTVGFGFGRIGLNLYLDEQFPGTGPEFLMCLSENHCDPKDYPWVKEPTMGNVHQEAWELFKAVRAPKNIERLNALGLRVLDYAALCY